MTEYEVGLQVLRRTRKVPKPGDIFALQLPDDSYLFGRVIGANLPYPSAVPMPGSFLIYVYAERSRAMEPDLEALTPDRLLIPPTFVNRRLWLEGYFETVGHEDLAPTDLLPTHCFWHLVQGRFVNERNEPLPNEVAPSGVWALAGYGGIDYEVSRALGLPGPWDDD